MSKTFNGFASDRELTVKGYDDSSQVDLLVRRSPTGFGVTGIAIALSDAPALALAILEAAGVKDTSTGGLITHDRVAVTNLKIHIEKQAKRTTEAKERAELEAEALELVNAAVIECGNPPYPSVERMGEKVLRRWLAVARRARELAKEATK